MNKKIKSNCCLSRRPLDRVPPLNIRYNLSHSFTVYLSITLLFSLFAPIVVAHYTLRLLFVLIAFFPIYITSWRSLHAPAPIQFFCGGEINEKIRRKYFRDMKTITISFGLIYIYIAKGWGRGSYPLSIYGWSMVKSLYSFTLFCAQRKTLNIYNSRE